MSKFNPPARFDRLVEAVNDRDREYFAQHPNAKSYLRPFVPGELWPLMPQADLVEVTSIAPGLRIRRPILTNLIMLALPFETEGGPEE